MMRRTPFAHVSVSTTRRVLGAMILGAAPTIAGGQSVTSATPSAVTVQGGTSAILTATGTGLLSLDPLWAVTPNGAAAQGVTASWINSHDTQRRLSIAASLTALPGPVTVQGRTAAGAVINLPASVNIVAAPSDASITVAALSVAPSASYVGGAISATVTLSSAPVAPLTVELVEQWQVSNLSPATQTSTITVPAGSTSAVASLVAKGTGVHWVRAQRPPYTTGPVDTVQVSALPTISTIAFGGPLTAGVNATLIVSIVPTAQLGGVLTLTSSSTVLFLPATVPLSPNQSTLNVLVGVGATQQSVSGTLTAAIGSSVKSLPFTVQGTMPAPPITAVSPSADTVTGGLGVTRAISLGAAAASGMTMKVTSSHPAVVPAPVSVAVPMGATSVNVPLTTSPVATTTTAQLTFELGTSSAVTSVTVRPPHPSSVSFTPPLAAGQPVLGKVTLNGIVGGPPGVAVTLTSNHPTFATPPASITVLPGAFEQSFTVQTQGGFAEPTKGVQITASSSFGSAVGTLNLQRTTGIVSGVSAAPSPVDAGAAASGTITLDLPSKVGGTVVNLTSSHAALSVPASVTVPGGSTSAPFTATAPATAGTTANTNVVLTATDGLATRTATITVRPPLTLVSLTGPSAVDGGQPSTIGVNFNHAIPNGASATVALTSSSPTMVVPATVTVSGGQSSASVSLTTSAVTQNQSVQVTATYQGVTVTRTISVYAPPVVASVVLTPDVTWSGGSSSALVTLNRTALAPTTVSLVSSNPTVASVPATATVLTSQSSATVPIALPSGTQGTAAVVAALNGASAADTLTVAAYVTTFILSVPSKKDTLAAGPSLKASIILPSKAQVPLVVTLSSISGGLLTMPPSVTIPTNGTSATFSLGVTAPLVPTTVSITASGGGYTKTQQYVVLP